MNYYCTKNRVVCEFTNRYGQCTITACVKNNENTDSIRLLDTSLVYNKTPEEEFDEQEKVSIAENYFESLGIKVKTDKYGYYRNTYDILKDFGEYLSKK